jgi:hypothetical protein
MACPEWIQSRYRSSNTISDFFQESDEFLAEGLASGYGEREFPATDVLHVGIEANGEG